MATITNSNLYPPVIDTYMPAFLADGNNEIKKICRVYFSISSFNSIKELNHAQVTLSNQNTNVSVLNKTKYPCSIKLTKIFEDITRTSEDKYYIEIEPADLEPEYWNSETGEYESRFDINQYYKVQIRFSNAEAPIDITSSEAQAVDSWLAANLSHFSEWSTVCLVRAISTPILSLNNFDITASAITWASTNVDLIGTLSFEDPLETETLKSYRIKLYNENEELLIDSEEIYSNNYININEINYTFKYLFQDGAKYIMDFTYTTTNLYTAAHRFPFTIVEKVAEKLDATLSALLDSDNGRIGINIKGINTNAFTGNITIRRSSSESNFTIWEDIHTVAIENIELDYTWYDYTVKSGVWYKYCAQKRGGDGARGVITYLEKPQMIIFDDMFLLGNQRQLNIRFNPQISSFKKTVLESKTDTIGSKYPFIKRNGYVGYREFPISGLISCFMDYEKVFTSKEEIYGNEILSLYEAYNQENSITDFNDFTFERDFRDKVLEFLYTDNVKLFRSPTEGNILVKLMNISLTPNTVLGRRIYTFNCTAYEVADFTLENCDYYNIQLLGKYSELLSLSKNYPYVGQLNDTFAAETEILSILEEKYANYAEEGYTVKIQYLDYLRIEFNSPPYLIKEPTHSPQIFPDGTVVTTNPTEAKYLGYLVYINDKPIVITNGNVYEIKGEDVKITSIVFPVETEALIDYNIMTSQVLIPSLNIVSTSYYNKVGQLMGTFESEELLYQTIWNRYYEETDTYKQALNTINSIKIEADEGTIVYVKESEEESFDKHVIGDTMILSINNADSYIKDFYFYGVHFELATELDLARDTLTGNKYAVAEGTCASLDDITPSANYVYTLTNGDNYIWYQNTWHMFDINTQDIACTIEAVVDYYCEIMKGMYA